MITPYPLSKLTKELELVPQAIIGRDISELCRRYGWKLEEGQDDFDAFLGTAFLMRASNADRGTAFAIMHYKGHPRATSTIYLPFEIEDVASISNIVAKIARELDISEKIVWQRKDGLETHKP